MNYNEFEDSNGEVWRFDYDDRRVYHVGAELEMMQNGDCTDTNGYYARDFADAISLLMEYGYIDEVDPYQVNIR